MAVSTQNAGELTAEQVATILTQPLEQQSVFLAAGPQIFDTDGSPVRIPGAPVADPDSLEWYGENELIGEVDPEFSELELLPSTMKSIKTITRFSNELARQSIVSLDAALKSRLVSDVAAAFDAQFLGVGGDGTTKPKGLLGYTGTQEVELTGGLTLDDILAAQALALGVNADLERMRLVVNPADFMVLRGAKDGQDRYMLEPDATKGAGFQAVGVPVSVSSRMPAGNAVLADFSQIAVARDLAPTVKLLTERYADWDQQAIRVVARYDAKPINAQAIVKITGITND